MRKLIICILIFCRLAASAQSPIQQFWQQNQTAAGGGYSPPPITSGLAYDYDPAFGVTLSGGYVSTIASQQSSNTLTNSNPMTNPIAITTNAINGYSVIDYSGVGNSMIGLDFAASISGEHTIFIVGSYTYSGEVLMSVDVSNYMINRSTSFSKSDATPTKAYTPVAGTFYTFSAYQDGSGNSAVAVNDVFGTEVSQALSYAKIGGYGFSNSYNGKIARIIIYNVKLSSGDITTVSNYLKARYGHY